MNWKISKIGRTAYYYSFLAPAVLLFCVFFLWPLISVFILSFQDFNPLKGSPFVGVKNYIDILAGGEFAHSLKLSLIYACYGLPLVLSLALFLALLIDSKRVKGKGFFKLIFFLPQVTPVIVTGIIWKWLFSYKYGSINTVLNSIGLPPQNWLVSLRYALLPLVMVSTWIGFGLYLLIFTANLQIIDPQLHDSASIDGATAWQKLIYVTLPQMKPSMILCLMLAFIFFFREFSMVYIMTGGGPGRATELIVYHIYRTGFGLMNIGGASAGTVIMIALILIAGVLIKRLQTRRLI